MSSITWKNTAGLVTTAAIVDGEAVLHTSNGLYYAPVKVTITGRTLTQTPAGTLGTRCSIAFEDSTVSGWCR